MCQPIEPPRLHTPTRDDAPPSAAGVDGPARDQDGDCRSLGEYRQRVQARVLAQLPTTEQAAQVLRELVDGGLPGYTESIDDPAAGIPAEWPGEVREFLVAWEARLNDRSRLWAEDRFRLGFALGSGQYARLLTAFDW